MKTTPEMVKEVRNRTGAGLVECKQALDEFDGDVEKAIELLRKKGAAVALKKAGKATKEGRIEYLEAEEGISVIEMNAETDFVVNNELFRKFQKELTKLLSNKKTLNFSDFLKEPLPERSSMTVEMAKNELIAILKENITIPRALFFAKRANSSFGIYSHGDGKIVSIVELEGSSKESALAKEIAMQIVSESPEYLTEKEIPEDVRAKEEEIAKSQAPTGKPPKVVDQIVQGKLMAFYKQTCLLRQTYIKDNTVSIADLLEKKSKEIGTPLKIIRFFRFQVGS